MKTGKVLWVLADEVNVRDGMLLFSRSGEKPDVVAGFNLSLVDHA